MNYKPLLDRKGLNELREQWNTNNQVLRLMPFDFDVDEALDTLDVALKVVEAVDDWFHKDDAPLQDLEAAMAKALVPFRAQTGGKG
jgi:hypothetical protein